MRIMQIVDSSGTVLRLTATGDSAAPYVLAVGDFSKLPSSIALTKADRAALIEFLSKELD